MPTSTLARATSRDPARRRHALFAAGAQFRGLTRVEVARQLGYSWTHVKEYLDGNRVVSDECAEAINGFLESARKELALVA